MISNLHPNHTYTCVRENDTEYHPEILRKTEKALQNATLFQCKNTPKKLILEVFSCLYTGLCFELFLNRYFCRPHNSDNI